VPQYESERSLNVPSVDSHLYRNFKNIYPCIPVEEESKNLYGIPFVAGFNGKLVCY